MGVLVNSSSEGLSSEDCLRRRACLFEWRRMPFGMCNASATFQRAIARALQRIVNREGSMVMAYIDDIVIATETLEDHIDRLREVFQCLPEAGFKMRVSK